MALLLELHFNAICNVEANEKRFSLTDKSSKSVVNCHQDRNSTSQSGN